MVKGKSKSARRTYARVVRRPDTRTVHVRGRKDILVRSTRAGKNAFPSHFAGRRVGRGRTNNSCNDRRSRGCRRHETRRSATAIVRTVLPARRVRSVRSRVATRLGTPVHNFGPGRPVRPSESPPVERKRNIIGCKLCC